MKKNGLYEKTFTTKRLVDQYLKGHHPFVLTYESLGRAAAYCEACENYGQHTSIVLSKENLKGDTLKTMGILDHEFGHMQTAGFGLYDFIDENGYRNILEPTEHNYKRIDKQGNQDYQPSPFVNSTLFSSRIIEEGITELFKQSRYTEEECRHSYENETGLMKLLNEFCYDNELEWQAEYLHGFFSHYDNFFGYDVSTFIYLLNETDQNGECNDYSSESLRDCKEFIAETFARNIEKGQEIWDCKNPDDVNRIIRKSIIALNCFNRDSRDEFIESLDDSLDTAISRQMGNDNNPIKDKLKDYIIGNAVLAVQKQEGIPIKNFTKNIEFKTENGNLVLTSPHIDNLKIEINPNERLKSSGIQGFSHNMRISANSENDFSITFERIDRISNLEVNYIPIEQIDLHLEKDLSFTLTKPNTRQSTTINLEKYFEDKFSHLQDEYIIQDAPQDVLDDVIEIEFEPPEEVYKTQSPEQLNN